MSIHRSLIGFASLFFIAVVAGGCAAKNTGSESITAQEAADSTDSSDSNGQSSHFSELFTGSVPSKDPQEAATSVAASAGVWPAGCATRKVDPTNPRVVDITFNECTGPFGLVKLSGTMIATFSTNADGTLHVDLQSSGLTANGHPVTHTGSGDITINGTARDVRWHGDWTRVNKMGETVAHTTDLTIAIDTGTHCRVTDGTATTTVADRVVDSTIKGYTICRDASGVDACPSGTITHTHVRSGRTLSVSFDGSAEATLTGPRGGTIQVPLVCGASAS